MAPRATTTAKTAATNIVGPADIRRTRPGSPERAILLWAQAVQFGDLASVRSAYSKAVRAAVSPTRINAASRVVSSLLGRPEIVGHVVRGTRARVRAAIISYDAGGGRSIQPETFRLRREDGHWRLDDAALLLDSAAAIRRSNG